MKTYTDEEMERIGNFVAEVLGMRRAKGKNGWATDWGWKTGQGVFKTILRIAEDIQKGEFKA